MSQDLERERREDDENKSSIEEARDNLYKPGAPSVIHRTPENNHLPEDEELLPTQEFTPPVNESFHFDKEKATEKVNNIFRKLLIAAVVFFVLSLGAAAFMYFYGNNTISAKNIKIEVTAPPSVPSSDTFSFDINIQNGNNAELINAAIIVDYPDGTRYVDDNTKPLVSERFEIGTVGKGQIIRKTASARLFGEENAEKNIKVRFEYKVENSNGQFSKDEDFDVILRLAPVVLSVNALNEVNNNQEVVLTAKVISNSNNVLNNVALNVTYPYGFTYIQSNLEVESGERGEFPIGVLQPNETKTVEIRGTINGQSSEDKVFKFNVGTAEATQLEKVATSLAVFTHEVTIRGDFLASSIVFGNNKQYGAFDESLAGKISWKNTLSNPINDAEFLLKITGDLIDTKAVSADSGFYDSNSSTIEWNKSTDKDLEEIIPGQTGSFGFNIPLFSYEDAVQKKITNPKVNLSFDIEGQRITDRNVTETIRSSFTKVVPIITTVQVDTEALSKTGPIANTGPTPPKAETKTTYTVAVSLSNTVNEITNGEVTLKLPNYVKYEALISPQSDKVGWNETTRLLRWTVGSVPVRTGYGSQPRTLYFKVSILPSRTQIGQVLQLATNITFTGKDAFANADIKGAGENVTTVLEEGGAVSNNGQVVE